MFNAKTQGRRDVKKEETWKFFLFIPLPIIPLPVLFRISKSTTDFAADTDKKQILLYP